MSAISLLSGYAFSVLPINFVISVLKIDLALRKFSYWN